MTRPGESGEDHLGFLDGLRGGAALWVLLAHCMIWGGWYGIPLPSAKIAVDIFMVASGFLMVYQYRRREAVEPMDAWRTAARFWARRFFRIAPVYYLFLGVIYLFWDSYAGGLATLQEAAPERWARLPEYQPVHYHVDWLNTLIHATFLFGLLPAYAASNLSADWSIGLEMQFYAAFPLLFWLFRRHSWLLVLAGAFVLAEVCQRGFGLFPGPVPGARGLFSEPAFLPLKLPLFLIGMLLGEVFCLRHQAPRRCVLMSVGAELASAQYSIWVSVAVGIVLWLTWSPLAEREGEPSRVGRVLNRVLSNRIAGFMAETSYTVYLLHGLFISFLGGYLFRRADVLEMSAAGRTGLLAAVVIPAVYLTAWGLHHALEKPGIAYGRRWIERWLPRRPGPGQPTTSS